MKEARKERFRNWRKEGHLSFVQSLFFKSYATVFMTGMFLLVFSIWLLRDSLYYVVEDLMDDRMESDIDYLCDELVEHGGTDAEWSVRDGALYIGNKRIGDGLKEHAETKIMDHCGAISNSLFYFFVITEDEEAAAANKGWNLKNGHYKRVAGTTRGGHGVRLEGTFLEKSVADALEKSPDGSYAATVDIDGRQIFARYELLRNRQGTIVGCASVGRSIRDMHRYIFQQQQRAVFLIAAFIIGTCMVLGLLVHSIIERLQRIQAQLRIIGTGDYPEKPLAMEHEDELSFIADTIDDMVISLKRNEQIKGELKVAAEIQQAMLPNIFPAFPEHDEFDIYAAMRPARNVGGDLYDFFMTDETHIAVIVGDVSGKGMPAAMFMVRTKTLLKSYLQMGLPLSEVIFRTNQNLCEGNDDGFFVTAWIGILDTESGMLTYVNAGHNPPVILTEDGKQKLLRSKPQLVLAGLEGTVYRVETEMLSPGSRLFLYTDGVTEAVNEKEELFGTERMMNALAGEGDQSARGTVERVRKELRSFIGSTEQYDDITILMLHYIKKAEHEDSVVREFEAEEERLDEVLEFAEKELTHLGCPEKMLVRILISVEELYLNIAKYAYGDMNGLMRLEIAREGTDGAKLVFSDHGIPFDPLRHAAPDITQSVGERKIGGLGIYMVRSFMDAVNYKYENGQNILTVIKNWNGGME